MEKRLAKTLAIAAAILLIWGAIVGADYRRVCHGFERPIFAIYKTTADDGGSGVYKGLGYFFVIKGNFMPEDEYPGVTHSDFYLFGRHIKKKIRD